ncbi:hypothetical protein [Mycolicibacterium parafortuitum]|uniref:Uncharacterized protein n=1 Tax=Mycolicibacterium parafortuitum TaxID=39692 RepID=A0A375YK02_MYCPF|nr:hypothetical protein [Mycolicibacterium parafortuitum]ORB25299.1 hypothetical protein BST38_27605 [Mycolicibacterium parafortuitum]SRX81488.1 hypothetical protein MPP7335_03240 [Mycolicibacterium parafortuitum]
MSILDTLAGALVLVGIVVGLAGWARFRQPLVGLGAMLEFFTAAGLVQLTTGLEWPAIVGVAALIAIQYLVVARLTADLTSNPASFPFVRKLRRHHVDSQ